MGHRKTIEQKKAGKLTDRFARLGHRILTSPAYRALSPNARSLLVELTMMENGKNNGTELFLSVRDAAARMGVCDLKAACSAFDELQAMGFVAMTASAHFAIKARDGSRARCWRLTWQAVNGKAGPTNDFEKAKPTVSTAACRRMDRGLRALARWRKEQAKGKMTVVDSNTLPTTCVVESATSISRPLLSVGDSGTRLPNNTGKPPDSVVEESTTHTATPARWPFLAENDGAGRKARDVPLGRREGGAQSESSVRSSWTDPRAGETGPLPSGAASRLAPALCPIYFDPEY